MPSVRKPTTASEPCKIRSKRPISNTVAGAIASQHPIQAQSRDDRSALCDTRNSPRWLAIAASLFVAVGVCWFAVRSLPRQSTNDHIADEVVANHMRSLLASHLTDVASSDRHTVKPWFAGKLDFAPIVADYSSAGFPLTGGRLDYLEHRPVAAFVYHRRQHAINVFIWPTADANTAPQSMASPRLPSCSLDGCRHGLLGDFRPEPQRA